MREIFKKSDWIYCIVMMLLADFEVAFGLGEASTWEQILQVNLAVLVIFLAFRLLLAWKRKQLEDIEKKDLSR